MIKDTWSEVGRLESLFVEILDDPIKKEVLLYPICYCQLVRKEGVFEIELKKLLRCANKTFRSVKGSWQDILLELNLFQVKSQEGKVLLGKELLTLSSEEGYTVSLKAEYREDFQSVCSKLIKYWGILSKVSAYSRKNLASEYVHILSMVFNEGLFREAVYYSEILDQRFPAEAKFWKLVRELGEFYAAYLQSEDLDIKRLAAASEIAKELGGVYYSVDMERLLRDIGRLKKTLMKGEPPFPVKIELLSNGGKRGGFITRIIDFFRRRLNFLKKGGGKQRWTLMNSETGYSYFTGAYWKRQRHLQINT